MERQIAALLCRTSERGADAAAGTRELAELLGARIIGSPGEPRAGDHRDDLRDGRGCLLEAGGQIDDALEAGRAPILLAPECSVSVSTLPVVVARRPAVRVLWLDAHPDFNTPETSTSGYLAGMCLAGACGWRRMSTGSVEIAIEHSAASRIGTRSASKASSSCPPASSRHP